MIALDTISHHIIRDNNTLAQKYHNLGPGDLVLGRVRLKPSEEFMLLDLLERGVRLFPSALAQQSCRSKVFQALLFAPQMLPYTIAVHDQHDMLAAVNLYGEKGIRQVITKLDRKNAGLGIHLWAGVEDVYNQSALGSLPFPFVLQPFQADSHDVRVIILGDYLEAYQRENIHNFRNNLHCGGHSQPCELSAEQLKICREVMARGKFPYAHLDLMVSGDKTFLAEINLGGGIRGAKIGPAEYKKRIDEIHCRAAAEKI